MTAEHADGYRSGRHGVVAPCHVIMPPQISVPPQIVVQQRMPQSEAEPISVDTQPRSVADRLARKVLLIEGADPKALMSLKGSLLLSAIRCVLTYAILPALAPVFGFNAAVSAPVGIVVSVAAIALSLHSVRRVWLADWTYRWTYTAFIGTVLIALVWLLMLDVQAVLS